LDQQFGLGFNADFSTEKNNRGFGWHFFLKVRPWRGSADPFPVRLTLGAKFSEEKSHV
jgi:hypothetical protein